MTIYYVIGYAITATMLDVLLYDDKRVEQGDRLLVLAAIYIVSLFWPLAWIMILCHVLAKLIRRALKL